MVSTLLTLHSRRQLYFQITYRLAKLSTIRGAITKEDKELGDIDGQTGDIQEHKIVNTLNYLNKVRNFSYNLEENNKAFDTGKI